MPQVYVSYLKLYQPFVETIYNKTFFFVMQDKNRASQTKS